MKGENTASNGMAVTSQQVSLKSSTIGLERQTGTLYMYIFIHTVVVGVCMTI